MVDDIIPIKRLKELSEKGLLNTEETLQEKLANINQDLVRRAVVGHTELTYHFFGEFSTPENRHEILKALSWAGYNVQQENNKLIINWG